MGFGKQVVALVRKDFQIAKASPKASICEFICPLLTGIIAGLFILLIGLVQSLFGSEYSNVLYLDEPNGTVFVVPANSSNPYGMTMGSALFANKTVNTSKGGVTVNPMDGWSTDTVSDYQNIANESANSYKEMHADIIEKTLAGHGPQQALGLVLDNVGVSRNFSMYVDSRLPTKELFKFMMRIINLFYDVDYTQHLTRANPSMGYPEAVVDKRASYQPIFFLMNFRAVFASSGMGLLLLGFIPSLLITAGRLVDEKKNKVRESLKVMGTGDAAYLTSNFISSFLRLGVGTMMIAFALAAFNAIPASGILPVMGYGALFAISLIAFAQIMPSLFSQSIWSNVLCILFLWGGSTVSSLATGFDFPLQVLCSFCSPVAFYMAVLPILSDGAMQLSFTQEAALVMLCVDIVLYIVIGNYIYAVSPGEYGVPKHPLFFLGFGRTKAASGSPTGSPRSGDPARDSINSAANAVVKEITSSTAGGDGSKKPNRVVVKNLLKYYGANIDNPAVSGLDMEIQAGEIFALLGHNGAGKTTTMSILTGMVTASDYDQATVDGLDITADIDQIRQKVGLCPQFDVLFGDLTARQHLELFAAIKGTEGDTERIDYLLRELELLDETKPADKFSGGMKRRLSVGNALVGGATLIFLDEPSSGMDPLNRRRMWNLLKSERDSGKTLVLTTHFMEEADYLGDRIAIMSHGHMYCCDTSQRLKEQYGVGFYLSLVKPPENADEANVEGALKLIKRFAKGAKLHHESSGDVTFMLPTNTLSIFGEMLGELELELSSLKFHSYGVAMNTLEDVFVSISTAEEKKGKEKASLNYPAAAGDALRGSSNNRIESGYGGTGLDSALLGNKNDSFTKATVTQQQTCPPHLSKLFEEALTIPHDQRVKVQAKAIFKRKMNLLLRNNKMKLMVLFCPLLFISLAFLTMQPQPKNRTIDIRGNNDIDFKDLTLFWLDIRDREDTKKVRDVFDSLYHQRYPDSTLTWRTCQTYDCYTSGAWIPVKSLNFITGIKQPPYPAGFLLHQVNLDQKFANYTMYYNTQYKPSQSMELSTLFNAAIEIAAGASPDIAIHVNAYTGFPAEEGTNSKVLGPASVTFGKVTYNFMFTGIYTVVALTLLVANCVLPVTDEIQRGVYHTLRVHGMTARAYYIGNMSFDFLCMLYPWVIFTIAMYIRGVEQFESAVMVYVLLSAVLLNIHILCHAYILANVRKLKPVMFTGAIIGMTIGQMGAPYMINLSISNIDPLKDFAEHIKPYLLSLTPSCAWYHLLDNASDQIFESSPSVVNFDRKNGMTALTFIFQIVELVVPFYILYRIINEKGSYRQLKKTGDTKAATVTLANNGSNAAAQQDGVIAQPMLKLPAGQEESDALALDAQRDPDVLAEERRVLEGDPKENMISVKKLLKCFGYIGNTTVAVDEVSFGLKPGECFGLLGPNGAGKTTSCKAILREYDADGGDIDYSYTQFTSEATKDEKFLKTRLGMCSQSDTLWEHMTATEHMDHYLSMRLTTLYEPEAWKDYIAETIDKVQLENVKTKHAGGFSGGMKRKLAVAIAMYTGAVAVFLDEPSTGMDPFARRALWTVILEALSLERAVLLTTHSMEEADAVCARIAIMTAGQMRCIGSSQHLKNRFGSGYVVTLSLDPERVNTDEQFVKIDEMVIAHFGPGSKMTEGLGSQRKYAVGDVPSLAKAFTQIEGKRQDWALVGYSIAQTSSLEQIFLKFVGRDDSQNDT